MLRLVEAITDPGRAGKANEDGYGLAGDFAWIIDGATGLADAPLLDAPSDAAWLTASLHDALTVGANTTTDPRALLTQAADRVTAAFKAERKRVPAERYEVPTAAVLLAHFGDVVTVTDLGDCGLYLRHGNELARYGGSERGKALEQQNAQMLMSGGKGRTGEVLDFLRKIRNMANTPEGYAIFAPEPGCTARARTQVHAGGAGRALFMTDGFEAAEEDYGLYDKGALMASAEADLAGPLKALRQVEADDPHCTRYPRFKPSDDATAMLIEYGA